MPVAREGAGGAAGGAAGVVRAGRACGLQGTPLVRSWPEVRRAPYPDPVSLRENLADTGRTGRGAADRGKAEWGAPTPTAGGRVGFGYSGFREKRRAARVPGTRR